MAELSFHKWHKLRFLRMTNTASCGVKYSKKNGAAGRRTEEIHIIAKGESQLKLRTHPSSRASAKVYTRLSSSPVGINNVIKRKKACEGRNFTVKIQLGTEVEEVQKEKHVFPELVFIILLISLVKPKQCSAIFFAVSNRHEWHVRLCFAAPFHYRKHLKPCKKQTKKQLIIVVTI